MNPIIYRKIMEGVPPFHQKMLRMNYDIDLGEVMTALRLIFPAIGAEELLYTTPDRWECDQPLCEEVKVFSRDTFFQAVLTYAAPMPLRFVGGKTGIFDQTFSWYLRLFADDPANVAPDELLCGNFELYTDDTRLQAAYDALHKKISGHLIVDGAGKYLAELREE